MLYSNSEVTPLTSQENKNEEQQINLLLANTNNSITRGEQEERDSSEYNKPQEEREGEQEKGSQVGEELLREDVHIEEKRQGVEGGVMGVVNDGIEEMECSESYDSSVQQSSMYM